MSDPADLGRNEAQRQALSSLLARFTRDRDSLIAAIGSCQERLADLVARIESREAPASGAVPLGPAPPADELCGMNASLREDLERSVARAITCAQEAVRRTEELAAHMARPEEVVAVGEALGGLRAEVSRVDARVAATEAEVQAALTSQLEGVRDDLAHLLDEQRRAAGEAHAATREVQEALRRVTELAANQRMLAERLEKLGDVHAGLDAARADIEHLKSATERGTRAALEQLEGRVEPQLHGLWQALEDLRREQQRGAAAAQREAAETSHPAAPTASWIDEIAVGARAAGSEAAARVDAKVELLREEIEGLGAMLRERPQGVADLYVMGVRALKESVWSAVAWIAAAVPWTTVRWSLWRGSRAAARLNPLHRS